MKIKNLLAGVLLFAGGVHATTVQRLTLEDLAKKAHRIVAGKVRDSRTYWSNNRKLILTDYTIEVDENIKGTSPRLFQVTTIGGTIGTTELHVSGMPTFDNNENVVLFTESSGSYEVVVGLQQGKFSVQNGEVLNDLSTLSFADGRLGKGIKLPLTTFKSQIRSILAR